MTKFDTVEQIYTLLFGFSNMRSQCFPIVLCLCVLLKQGCIQRYVPLTSTYMYFYTWR